MYTNGLSKHYRSNNDKKINFLLIFLNEIHVQANYLYVIRTFLYDIHLYISQISFSFANKLFFSIKNHILILLSKVQLYCNQCMCYHTVYIMY